MSNQRVVDRHELFHIRSRLADRRLVMATGCFDLLHVGHVLFLEEAASLGDYLLVGVNSDDSVRAIKGSTRPVVSEEQRLCLVAALRCVDAAFLFDEPAVERWIHVIRPTVFVTNHESLDLYPSEQIATLAVGGVIHVVSRVGGPSTTSISDRLTLRSEDDGE